MGEQISRKTFLQRCGLLGAGALISFSKFGNIKSVKAAVADNSSSENVSNDTIYIDSANENDVFTSGQKVKDLAKSVNDVNDALVNKVKLNGESVNGIDFVTTGTTLNIKTY